MNKFILLVLIFCYSITTYSQSNEELFSMVEDKYKDFKNWNTEFILENKWELVSIYERNKCFKKGEIKKGDYRQLSFDAKEYTGEFIFNNKSNKVFDIAYYDEGFQLHCELPNEKYGFVHNIVDKKYLVVIVYEKEVKLFKYRKIGTFHIYRLVE